MYNDSYHRTQKKQISKNCDYQATRLSNRALMCICVLLSLIFFNSPRTSIVESIHCKKILSIYSCKNLHINLSCIVTYVVV